MLVWKNPIVVFLVQFHKSFRVKKYVYCIGFRYTCITYYYYMVVFLPTHMIVVNLLKANKYNNRI